MNKYLELLWSLVMLLLYAVIDIIYALTPAFLIPKKDIKGQTVLVTGAGSGLGRNMSMQFAKRGCTKIVLWDINEKANESTGKLIQALGGQTFTYTVDLSSQKAIYEAAEKVKKDVGNIDILVNNAGIVTGKKFMKCSDELIQKTMEVNAMAHFWTVKSFLPSMMKRNKGHVISIASGAGFFGVTGLSDYCASKFAAVGFDESLREELMSLGKDGVHTTLVCPYFINTGMFDGVHSKYPFLLDMLDQDYVVSQIFQAMLINQQIIMLPRLLYVLLVFKSIFSTRAWTYLATVTGVNEGMDSFLGRKKTN